MDVRYRQLPVDALEFSDLEWAYADWTRRRGDRLAPAWTDMDLSHVPPKMLPRVCVVDAVGSPVDFTYRFWGTAITDMHHYDLTGKSVRELTPPEYGECIWQQYLEVFEAKRPLAFLTEVPLTRDRFAYYAVVRMPLSTDGEAIEAIMSLEQYDHQAGQLHDRFEALWLAGQAEEP